MPPGTATFTRLAVQFSNCRFVIWNPLVINKIKIVIAAVVAGSGCATIAVVITAVVAGSGCATIAIIEVTAVQ